MAFPAAESKNRQLKYLPQADFGRAPERFFLVGKDQFNNWQFCILKIRLIVCFCRDSTHVFILSAPTHYLIFMWGLSILLFSSVMESTFLVSKELLSPYNKENNAWLLVDAKFLFSCSTRHLTRSLWDVKSGAKLLNADWLGQRALFPNNKGTLSDRLGQF